MSGTDHCPCTKFQSNPLSGFGGDASRTDEQAVNLVFPHYRGGDEYLLDLKESRLNALDLSLALCDLDQTLKFDRFMPLPHGPLLPVDIKIGLSVFEISCSQIA